ncbi:hypothetical protein F2Q69_00020370 [Brassica cretica]|uniref:Uncharacterized protein n=1 Tax=Brassica cretica TaxID=69181 RepID=A0A8S9QB91_BRACR|nr:hypothetical protein F2Q69_00020370 [Brassica cretica]
MPSSTRRNKEHTLLFSDPARLKRTIRKGKRTASIDNNTCSSTDARLPPSTETTLSCMPSSTRRNKEHTLLFSDPARLKRTIRKGKRTASIDNNTCSSTDARLPPSTETTLS